MATDRYRTANEITFLNWHDLWSKSNQALANNKSPHVEPKVELPARQLLELLEMVKGKVR